MWKLTALSLGLLAAVAAAPVQDAIVSLDSNDPVERARATCPLSKMKEDAAPAVPKLIELLDDDTVLIHFSCDGKQGGWRHDDHTTPGREAAKTLSRIGEAAVKPLVAALEGGKTTTRANAAFAMQMVQDPHVIDPLIAALGDPAPSVREQAAWALSSHQADRVAPALARALEDPDTDVRREATWALGVRGTADTVEPLITALQDDDEEVRKQAAWALGVAGDPRSVEPLAAALNDESAGVREKAAWALGVAGDPRAVDALITTLDDPDQETRRQSAWALGIMGDEKAAEPLRALADKRGEDKEVRAEARQALKLLSTVTAAVQAKRTLSGEFSVDSGQRLRIEAERGDYRIETWDGDSIATDVVVTCYEGKLPCAGLLAEVTLGSRSSGNDVLLDVSVGSVKQKKKKAKQVSRQLAWNTVVRVPGPTSVRVDLRVGDVTVRGLAGDLEIDLGVGSVDIELRQQLVSRVALKSDMGSSELEGLGIDGEIEYRGDKGFGDALEWAGGTGNAKVHVEVGVGSISTRLTDGIDET